ncbi:MAG TPA: hypothetical protein VMJ74_17305, partial [Pseudomonadales bacterium]|nr:hypothetical protein [Pseudomonadales bacterium]
MSNGWRALTDGFPWFVGAGRFALPAYSEFMPPPRLGRTLCGELDTTLFDESDPYGWRIGEVEEAHQLRNGMHDVATEVMNHLIRFAKDTSTVHVGGPDARNLKGNPFWSDELTQHAAELARRRHVLLLALSLSKTQNDRGRLHWTLFGASEQGPERAFWRSFYVDPETERPARSSRAAIGVLLTQVFGETASDAESLYRAGFRILPAKLERRYPQWATNELPTWTKRFVVDDDAQFGRIRYLLTFRPFSDLPAAARRAYLE